MAEPIGAQGATTVPSAHQVFRPGTEVVVREIAGETLLIPIKGKLAQLQQIFVLTQVGAFIWERLDGENDLAAVRDAIADDFEVPAAQAEEDLLDYVGQLIAAGLVVEASDSEE